MTDTELLIQLAKLDGCEYCKNCTIIFSEKCRTYEDCPYEKECKQHNKFELDRDKLYAELNLQEVLNRV